MEQNEEQQVEHHELDNPPPVEPPESPSTSSTQSLGASIGAAATGAVGAVVGAAGGSVGAVVGAVVGSVVGGFVGKNVAEAIDPTVEENYWRDHYTTRPYVKQERSFKDYQIAYQTGYEGYIRYAKANKSYEEVESDLRDDYRSKINESSLRWDDVKYAVRDAWDRADRNLLSYQEDVYWRSHYTNQPYYQPNSTYDDYQPAFRAGYEGYLRYYSTGRSYDEVKTELHHDYNHNVDRPSLTWEDAEPAVRAAWHRIAQILKERTQR